MARRATLEIDGVTYKNVYEVSYEILCPVDDTGTPADIPRPGLIKVLREADPKLDIAVWATQRGDGNALDPAMAKKSGLITIRYFNDQSVKRISFKDAFISHYSERVPNTKTNEDTQVLEYFEISCGKLGFPDSSNGAEIGLKYYETRDKE